MVRALLQRPLLVFFYLAVADIQCEMTVSHLGIRVGVRHTMLFSQRHTFLEVPWSIFSLQLTLVYVPLLVCLEAGPRL